jgi:glucose-1-phosphate thymidylyltransferase
MRAIIPVAGIGSRLRPHTYSIPKVLLNVGGKPIIGHLLDKIIEEGFTEATLIVGYLGDKVREYVNKNYNISVDFIDQEERQGLAHSIYIARHTFNDEPIMIFLGDTIFDVNLSGVLDSQYSSIGVKRVENPKRFGIAELEGEFVHKLTEKPENPTTNLALVGLYFIKNSKLLNECLSELISKDIKTKGEYQLTDGLQLMIDRGEKITTFNVEGWYDCGKPETLLLTNKILLEKQTTKIYIPDVVIIPPVYISPSCQVSRSVIGPYTTISDGAIITESIIRNSIIGDDSKVYKTLLENSIIGNHASISGLSIKINAGDSTDIELF